MNEKRVRMNGYLFDDDEANIAGDNNSEMIVEDEREESEDERSYLFDDDEANIAGDNNSEILEQFQHAQLPTPIETLIANLHEAQCFNEHHNLRNDLMEHMWEFFR